VAPTAHPDIPRADEPTAASNRAAPPEFTALEGKGGAADVERHCSDDDDADDDDDDDAFYDAVDADSSGTEPEPEGDTQHTAPDPAVDRPTGSPPGTPPGSEAGPAQLDAQRADDPAVPTAHATGGSAETAPITRGDRAGPAKVSAVGVEGGVASGTHEAVPGRPIFFHVFCCRTVHSI
jgi:hypothetical protein